MGTRKPYCPRNGCGTPNGAAPPCPVKCKHCGFGTYEKPYTYTNFDKVCPVCKHCNHCGRITKREHNRLSEQADESDLRDELSMQAEREEVAAREEAVRDLALELALALKAAYRIILALPDDVRLPREFWRINLPLVEEVVGKLLEIEGHS